MTSLRILHVMRSPVGGLFRHVIDLAGEQAKSGHAVGIIADSSTGGASAEAAFALLEPLLTLGIERFAMSRHPGLGDWSVTARVTQLAAQHRANVVHGHGAKGGAYARLTPKGRIRVYTPHGGSLHYGPRTPLGLIYLGLERILMRRTELFLFESAYAQDRFTSAVGTPPGQIRVVHNGVAEAEFETVQPDPDASDFLFVGELRDLKGVDVLLEAVALLRAKGTKVTATIVGNGPDASKYREQSTALKLDGVVTFPGAMPARTAFRRGRILVVPSRAESLPYIVLEALAAGVPAISTRVGGIPEIFGANADTLIPPGDPNALAIAMLSALTHPDRIQNLSRTLQNTVKTGFSVATMTEQVLAAYRDTGAE